MEKIRSETILGQIAAIWDDLVLTEGYSDDISNILSDIYHKIKSNYEKINSNKHDSFITPFRLGK